MQNCDLEISQTFCLSALTLPTLERMLQALRDKGAIHVELLEGCTIPSLAELVIQALGTQRKSGG
jgi:hypothetical protein